MISSQQLQERLNAAYSEVLIEAKQSGTPISFIKNDKLIRQYPDGRLVEVLQQEGEWIEVELLD
jgi:hypothetical protein